MLVSPIDPTIIQNFSQFMQKQEADAEANQKKIDQEEIEDQNS
jgi:hypothetical protein